MTQTARTLAVGVAVIAAGVLVAYLRVNPYLYFAGYVILQYVVIATAWNILGGYAGYVNFGTPAFFALGAYTAVFLIQSVRAPLPVLIVAGGLVSALLGLGIGYLTLRLRGVFFSIATLALAIVLQTMIINWEYVGGSRGISVIRPSGPPFGSYVVFLFTVMVGLAVMAVITARFIERFGLIGPNGSGKTTLINCVAGSLRPDEGQIMFEGTDITALPPHRRTRLG